MTPVGAFALLFVTCLASIIAFRALTPNDRWYVSLGLACGAIGVSFGLWVGVYIGLTAFMNQIFHLLR